MERRSMMRPVSSVKGVLLWDGEGKHRFSTMSLRRWVEPVDGAACNLGDVGVGGVGIAGLVLLVPEVEVFAMLGGDEGG